jgi:two-component system cell cycle response regulator DivK
MKKILIVEDTPDNLEMMRVLFTSEGFDVCSATDGAAAVTLAESYQPDLIVMDIQLPVFDGYEATRRIKKIDSLARTPVLYAMADDYQRCQAAGCDAYMVKPAMPREILAKARELLN